MNTTNDSANDFTNNIANNILVWNKHHGQPPVPLAFYIGRGSPLRNPFSHKTGTKAEAVVGSRQEAVDAYLIWLEEQCFVGNSRVVDALREIYVAAIEGPIALICFCSPGACHGDVIKRVIVEAHNNQA